MAPMEGRFSSHGGHGIVVLLHAFFFFLPSMGEFKHHNFHQGEYYKGLGLTKNNVAICQGNSEPMKMTSVHAMRFDNDNGANDTFNNKKENLEG